MKFDVKESGSEVVVHLDGKLDFGANEDFERILGQLKAFKGKKVVFDLRDLSSIDSVGLGLFYIAKEDLSGGQNSVVLRNPQGYVSRLLDLTDARKMFAIE